MASTTEDGAFPVHVLEDKLTLYLAKKGARVLRVTFHDTSSWCHEITWICTLIPDKYSPHINHHKFRQQLPALREQFATHGRLTSIQIDQWMFVFGHDTEDTAWEMTTGYEHIKDIILKFLHEIHAQVTDIEMESVIKKVDAAAARKDQGPETSPRGTTDQDASEPQARKKETKGWSLFQTLKKGIERYTGMTGNSRAERSISAGQINTKEINQDNKTIIINLRSEKAAFETRWKAEHENIPQRTDIDIEPFKTLLKELFPESLTHIRCECMVFCFEHESMEDAIGMIVQHADIKEDILHFLQELDPSIDDIVMEVEVRELCESEEQTAETSETQPRGMTDPEHKGEEGTSCSHPQQKDETSHLHIQETGDDSSSLSLSPQKKKKYEDTCLPHPQETEEDKTSLQQTDEDTSHLQPQEVNVKDKFKYQPIKIEKGIGSHSSGYTSSDPSLKPLVKGQDSDRRASSDPSQGHSQSEEDPLLSTASHATSSQADRDLFYASRVGDLEKVKRVLSTPGVDVDCRVGEWSQTPVMEAAYKGPREVVELLVSKGADVSLVDKVGNNILHFACGGGDVETVKYVLSLNVVDIDARNKQGQTAADMARDLGHQRVVELLVSRGAQ